MSTQETTVEIITGLDRINAFIVRGTLNAAQRLEFWSKVPSRFRQQPKLEAAWSASMVVADQEWAERQLPDAFEFSTPAPRGTILKFVPAR
jgi:hypothetical protein